jgi:hypothetical protein
MRQKQVIPIEEARRRAKEIMDSAFQAEHLQPDGEPDTALEQTANGIYAQCLAALAAGGDSIHYPRALARARFRAHA